MPQLWIIAGPNGAGKTTLVSPRLERRITTINPDQIAYDLPRVDGRLDQRQAGELALGRRKELLASGADFAIETTLTGASALRLIRAARDAGYKVTLVFIGLTSAELSGRRVLDRVSRGGHAVPSEDLLRRYPAALVNLGQALKLVDRSYVFDNSSNRRRLLLIRHRQDNRFVADDLPEWAKTALADVLTH